jgi:hypothetical protein
MHLLHGCQHELSLFDLRGRASFGFLIVSEFRKTKCNNFSGAKILWFGFAQSAHKKKILVPTANLKKHCHFGGYVPEQTLPVRKIERFLEKRDVQAMDTTNDSKNIWTLNGSTLQKDNFIKVCSHFL